MMVINSNIESLIAQRVLRTNQNVLNTALERLSTGLRINRGKDDPAGLIVSENLRTETRAINAAITNAERADQFLNVAEGGMQEISNLLTELQALVTNAANTGGVALSERQAIQLQADSLLHTIDRLAGSVTFQGVKLLDGKYDYKPTVVGEVTDYHIYSANFTGDSMDVKAMVTASAQLGGLYLSLGGPALDLSSSTAQFSLDIAGRLGGRELMFGSGVTLAQMQNSINAFKGQTGVSAIIVNSGGSQGLKLVSTDFGRDDFVSVRTIKTGGIATTDLGVYSMQASNFNALNTTRLGSFQDASNVLRDEGQDIQASINGRTANADGNRIWLSGADLEVEFTLNDAAAQSLGQHTMVTIRNEGATFQLMPQVDLNGRVNIALPTINTNKLGNSTMGFLSDLLSSGSSNLVSGDLEQGQEIISEAIRQVSKARSRIGAFQKYTVGSTIRMLGISLENTMAAESAIRDADFAVEAANLTRGQILVQAATNVLALANNKPQQVLALLG